MNASIVCKPNVNNNVLDALAAGLPAILADVLEVPGGNLARLKPDQVSLGFSTASPRDVGSDIRIMVYAKKNDPRLSSENKLAKVILDRIVTLVNKSGEKYAIDIRLYLMEIGAAEHDQASS